MLEATATLGVTYIFFLVNSAQTRPVALWISLPLDKLKFIGNTSVYSDKKAGHFSENESIFVQA
jgi:hypothetical protein